MDNEQEFLCATCGEPSDSGKAYASIGGNLDPYIPAKLYHIQCIPTLKSEPSINIDDFEPCETCMVESYHRPQAATFVVHRDAVNHYYCEEHGVAQDLTRGLPILIPVNHAEPESRCKDCQAPLETGTVCADCVLRDNARLVKGFVEDPACVEMLAKEGFKLNLEEINWLLADACLPPYASYKSFSYAPKRFSADWFRAHVDHFIISFMVGVPLLIANAIASNVFTHHAVQVLQALHIPETILHGLGY